MHHACPPAISQLQAAAPCPSSSHNRLGDVCTESWLFVRFAPSWKECTPSWGLSQALTWAWDRILFQQVSVTGGRVSAEISTWRVPAEVEKARDWTATAVCMATLSVHGTLPPISLPSASHHHTLPSNVPPLLTKLWKNGKRRALVRGREVKGWMFSSAWGQSGYVVIPAHDRRKRRVKTLPNLHHGQSKSWLLCQVQKSPDKWNWQMVSSGSSPTNKSLFLSCLFPIPFPASSRVYKLLRSQQKLFLLADNIIH